MYDVDELMSRIRINEEISTTTQPTVVETEETVEQELISVSDSTSTSRMDNSETSMNFIEGFEESDDEVEVI